MSKLRIQLALRKCWKLIKLIIKYIASEQHDMFHKLCVIDMCVSVCV